ncbi:MAG: stage III sporulation protein AE [Oscillospiraceae bacterium]|jgi:stage III sporulation protein AE|nr:stage III sporulation protein AE [Oscillospiraceae bacterium]
MKKGCLILIVILLLLPFGITVNAAKIPSLSGDNNTADTAKKTVNASTDLGTYLAENGMSVDDSTLEEVKEISPEQIINKILLNVKEQSVSVIRLTLSLIVIVFICAIIAGLSDTVKTGTAAKVFSIISVMVCIVVLSDSLLLAFEDAKNTLINGANFMLSFIPIYTSVIASSGNITGAVGFNTIVVLFADMSLYAANYILIPLLSVCFAFSIIDSVNPSVKLGGIVDGTSKMTKWGLGFIMTLFTGILSIQTVVGANANALEQKTAKFIVSNAVPVVGGAVSDAYLTVKGSLNVLKSGVGSVGLISLGAILLPVIVSLALYRIALAICKITADITGVEPLQDLFENIGEVFSVVFSIVICFALMLIISIGVLML